AETTAVLQAMFTPEKREGQSLVAAVELAEELSRRGDAEARRLLENFFAEAPDLAEDMVLVEAGAFPYGKDARPMHLGSFYIDRYLVTNRDFERMVPGHRGLRDQYSKADDQPVIYVTWHEARLYARWRGCGCRLPTEQEWEKAAAWDAANRKKRRYPWGDEFEPSHANTWEGGPKKTTPVGAYSEGRSACGCYDMAGNVWEWMESLLSREEVWRVLRGGAWNDLHGVAACSSRFIEHPQHRLSYVGFRCART
ncbi:MAG: formylglycine-generating enzyme family protein, partial [Acidobacteriota bacterium]